MEQTEAKIIYENGWVLEIPAYNNAPLLFLEWLENFPAAKCPIHKVIRDLNCIKIRLNGSKEQFYDNALRYINANL